MKYEILNVNKKWKFYFIVYANKIYLSIRRNESRDKLISALNMQIDAISFFLLFQISLNYEEYIYIYFEGIK